MFKITDTETLRDAYTLLASIRDDVPATAAKQKSSLAAFMISIKKEIRAYNSHPAPDSRIVEERGIDALSWCSSRTSWTRSTKTMPPSGSGQIATMSFAPHPTTVPASASQTGTSCTAAVGTGSHIIRSALTFNQKGGQNHENQHLQPHF